MLNPQQTYKEFPDISFDSRFDSGNLMKVEKIEDKVFCIFKYHLYIASDNQNTDFEKNYRGWFFFKVTPTILHKPYYFLILNIHNNNFNLLSKMPIVYATPLITSQYQPIPFFTQNLNQQNINQQFKNKINNINDFEDQSEQYGNKQQDLNQNQPYKMNGQTILPINFIFHSLDPHYFAFSMPYTVKQNEKMIDALEKKFQLSNHIYFCREIIARSLEGRKIEMITISSYKGILGKKSQIEKKDIMETKIRLEDENQKNERNIKLVSQYEKIKKDLPQLNENHAMMRLKSNDTGKRFIGKKSIFDQQEFGYDLESKQEQPRFLQQKQTINNQIEFERKAQEFKKQYIFISARVHPGEVPASHTLEGLVNYIGQNEQLLDQFVFCIVPMLNPDGVYRGHWRTDTLGQNLNRYYQNPSKELQPAIYAVDQIVNQIQKNQGLFLYLDIHSHPSKRSCFIYGNSLPFLPQVESNLFAQLLALNIDDFDLSLCNFTEKNMHAADRSDGQSKEGSGRVAFYKKYKILHSYTIENNFLGGKFRNYLYEKQPKQYFIINF